MDRRSLLKWSGVAAASGMLGARESFAAVSQAVPFAGLMDYFNHANEAAVELGFTDPARQEAYARQVLMVLSGCYTAVLGSDINNPGLMPFIPSFMPYLAPNPDTFYGIAPIDPDGVYRVSGKKGTETIASVMLRDGGPHLGRLNGRRVGEIDLEAVKADSDGNFSFLLSSEPVADSAQQWFSLPAETRCLMARRVIKDISQVDGVWDIQRIDRKPAPLKESLTAMKEKMQQAVNCAKTTNRFVMEYMNGLRAKGAEKGFILDEQTNYGGLVSQIYFFHLFHLEEDEALVIECDVPKAKYWSLQVLDPFATSLDFVHHQTFMNDAQAHVDADGKVRFVLCASDPGVANWLDSGGWKSGAGLLWRWNDVAETPEPSISRVPLAALRSSLQEDTLWFDSAQRSQALERRGQLYKHRRLF